MGSLDVVRTHGDPAAAATSARDVLREMDPLIPLAAVRPMREVWRGSMARHESLLALLAAFGAVALLLASIGVYGVTAQAARRRTHEIGIRMALGAGGREVVRLMLRQGMAVVGLGLVAGIGVALAATRAMGSLLYGVAPTDPVTLVAVAVTLAGVAGVASYLPARRATELDPVDTLRAE
jgi:ABC-type antimicrobial peptide transport system permease subunit